jgi:large subunit ribosomal protein L24
MAAKLKKGDKVVVLAGKDKGKEGEISSVMPKEGKAVVDGINIAVRHTKQTQNSQGGRVPQGDADRPQRTWRCSTATARRPASASAWKTARRSAFAKTTGDVI